MRELAGRAHPLTAPEPQTASIGQYNASAGGSLDLFEASFADAAIRTGGARTSTLEVAGEPVDLSFSSLELESLLLPALSHLAKPRATAAHLNGGNTALGLGRGPSPSAVRANRSPVPRLRLLVWESASSGVALPYGSRPKDPTTALGTPEAGEICSLYHELGPGIVWGLSIFEPNQRVAGLWVNDVRQVPWWERAAPFRAIWQWALTTKNRCLAHAAAVGTSAGGILLVGPGGTGKSTTTIAAALSGMRVAGDDYVVLESRSAGVVAHSLYATTKLVPATVHLLPEVAPALEGSHAADGEKLVVNIEQIRPGALCSRLDVQAVVIPQISTSPCQLTTASMGEAFRALAPSTVFQHFVGGAAAFSPLAGILRQLACYRLTLGRQPRDAVALLASLIDEGARERQAGGLARDNGPS